MTELRKSRRTGGGRTAAQADLSGEIAMLRDLMRQLAERAEHDQDITDAVRILNALSQASARLGQVLRIQAQLGGGSDLAGEIRQAADLVRRELEAAQRGEPTAPPV